MGDEEFDTRIQNVLRVLSREQLEQVALAMARQLNRDRQNSESDRQFLTSRGIVPEDLKRSG
jgi:hypothetical protein